MRGNLPTLLALLTLAAPLAGQAKPGHRYSVGYYQTLPGKFDASEKWIADVVLPVFDELVRRKVIVSYLQLAQTAGAGENTHLFIYEVPNWAGLDGFTARLNEAAQATLHKSWSEATAGVFELFRTVRVEYYRPSGQQP
jgi:hypothetical protein